MNKAYDDALFLIICKHLLIALYSPNYLVATKDGSTIEFNFCGEMYSR